MTWTDKTEARAEAVLAGPPPAMATLERELLAAALPELQRQRVRADAAERELAVAQRVARGLADAYRHDKKPHPFALSYGLSCPDSGPAVLDVQPATTTGGG